MWGEGGSRLEPLSMTPGLCLVADLSHRVLRERE